VRGFAKKKYLRVSSLLDEYCNQIQFTDGIQSNGKNTLRIN
jgi:hypothetical protein